ncbi:MAG: HEAT repeat domain-containing protein [Spirochaetaceae bacterium]|nr:HEAT repeat domain-containing protein [Spirochaetaceae bacterium]
MRKIDPSYLLTDEQMRGFIVDGYVQVQTHLPAAVHEAIYNRSEGVFAGTSDPRKDFERNPQNNIVPMIPELRQVLEAPEVVGALTSILGPDYLLHPHRHCHPNYPAGSDGGSSANGDGEANGGGDTSGATGDTGPRLTMIPHKDGHANGAKPRHRVPRWAIIFYYPQDCPQEQGPTAVIPRSQYHNVLTHDKELQYPNKDSKIPVPESGAGGSLLLPDSYVYRELLPLSCPMGTVSIMHFDVGHSVLANLMERMRYGHKFVFMRTRNPSAPSWNETAAGWQAPALPDDVPDNEIVWTSIWNWLRGSGDRFARGAHADSGSVAGQLAALRSGTDLERAAAASALGFAAARDKAVAEAVAEPLCAALRDAFEPVRLNALYSLGAAGEAAIAHLLPLLQEGAEYFERNEVLNINHVADALATMGAPAVAPLVDALADPAEHVRASAAYGLGEMGPAAAGAVDALTRAVRDDTAPVRFHAICALGMIGTPAAPIIDALIPVLDSEDGGEPLFEVGVSRSQLRNVAVQALIRIDARTPAATAALARAVTDREPYVAAFAGEQLRRIGTAEALGQLADALSWARWFSSPVVTEEDRKQFFAKLMKVFQRQRGDAPVTAV